MPSVDGIVSGFDTTALIEGLSTAYSVPLQFMEGDLADEKATLEKISGLSNRLEDLSEAIGKLQGDDGLVAYTATSSNEAAFTASAEAGAAPGSYTIDVQRLATNETEVSQGFADKDAAVLGTGTFSVTLGDTTTDITLDGTNNSLQGLADAINDVDGMSAYVIDTRDGAEPYKLVVQGDETGSDSTLTLDASALTGGTATPSFTEEVTAEDALVTVNNVQVYSASNSFDSLPGITLDLTSAGEGPTQLDVGLDQEAMLENVQAFVDAYNEVQSFYDANTAFNAEEGIAGALVGDSTARRVMETLGTKISNPSPIEGNDNPFTALSQIGIATDRDGSLRLDEDRLAEVLENNLSDVQDMFTAEDGALGGLRTTIDEVFVDPESGTLESRKDSINSSIEDLELRIERQEVRLEDYTSFLREKFTAMEVAMSQFEGTASYLTSMFAPKSDS